MKYRQRHVHPQLLPGVTTASQRATLKFFAVVPALLLVQVLVGGAMAHFKAEPGNFYGFDLAQLFPVTILRTWHLQLAILWIATAFVAGGLFMASAFGQTEPRGQKTAINILFVALVLVIAGSLLGEVLGTRQWLGQLWFWFGNQGWEYLEIGRAWQILLVIGLVGWTILLVRGVGPARRDAKLGKLPKLFLLTAATIPLFYLPALFFGSSTNFTIVDTWRFWIIHLWVEGFFELFATVMVAVTFFKLGLVTRQTATRVIYIDAILFLGSGIIGTGHHWYWTGQSSISMALSAVFSAMEPVPLVLLTLDAADFVRLTSAKCDVCSRPVNLPHKWTFYFLIAVGVWNFIGAGIFGFLINLPIVSYYEAGTNLTVNHGHAALMGVFGMLAIAMLVFALRQVSTDDDWRKTEKYIRVSFWGLNIGLGLMVLLNLFPTGVLQFLDVANNGYWHARSREFATQPLMRWLEWARLPADAIFIVFGALPLFIATMQVWLRKARRAAVELPT
jgi:nitric oxide reductase subunit B